MEDPVKKVIDFIETKNCFEVMGQLRKLGVLSASDIKKAMRMSRDEWINFMMEKAGIAGSGTECGNCQDEE